MGIALLTITVIFAGLSFTIAQDVDESPVSDSGFISGYVILTVYDENGNVKQVSESHNTIVVDGLNTLVDNTFPGSAITASGALSHMGIGTDDETITTLAFDNTGLGAALAGCARDAFDSVVSAGSSDSDTDTFADISVTVTSTFLGSAGCDGSIIDEVGVFNDATGGEIFARSILVSPVTALGTDDTLVIDWTFSFTDS